MQNCESDGFPHHNKKYRCCCGSYHIKTGARMVGIVVFILVLMCIVKEVFKLANTGKDDSISSVVIFTLQLIPVGLMMFGIQKDRRYFLIPQMILMIFQEGIMILATLFLGYLVIMNTNVQALQIKGKEHSHLPTILAFGLCILAMIMYAWFINILFRCYGYIKEKNNYSRNAA